MTDDRITRLSQRFTNHTVTRLPARIRSRERHSFYVDGALVERLATTYREVNHDLHPQSITKSDFLEALMDYGLAHLPAIIARLTPEQTQEAEVS